MSIKGDLIAVGVAGAVLALAGWYAKNKVASVATDAADAIKGFYPNIDPTSDQNFAYQGVSAFTRWLTGSQGDFGTIMWDYANKAEPAPQGDGTLINYTPADAAKESDFIRRLENGMSHGL